MPKEKFTDHYPQIDDRILWEYMKAKKNHASKEEQAAQFKAAQEAGKLDFDDLCKRLAEIENTKVVPKINFFTKDGELKNRNGERFYFQGKTNEEELEAVQRLMHAEKAIWLEAEARTITNGVDVYNRKKLSTEKKYVEHHLNSHPRIVLSDDKRLISSKQKIDEELREKFLKNPELIYTSTVKGIKTVPAVITRKGVAIDFYGETRDTENGSQFNDKYESDSDSFSWEALCGYDKLCVEESYHNGGSCVAKSSNPWMDYYGARFNGARKIGGKIVKTVEEMLLENYNTKGKEN